MYIVFASNKYVESMFTAYRPIYAGTKEDLKAVMEQKFVQEADSVKVFRVEDKINVREELANV